MTLSHGDLLALAPRLGVTDTACPLCGPDRHASANRRRRVLRIWREPDNFFGFHCARCGASGWSRENGAEPVDFVVAAQLRSTIAEREKADARVRIEKARTIWKQRHPIRGSIAEVYLRRARGYGGPLPATIGFLPARGDFPPAMVAAFGIATEPEPGRLAIADRDIRGVHLTRLRPDGLGKAGDPSKLMIGRPSGAPIMLAPPNDALGLAICEGIEDALSIHAATGLGVWAAGSAAHLPALADAVPAWIDCITVVADADCAGQAGAAELAARLRARGLHVEAGSLPEMRRAA